MPYFREGMAYFAGISTYKEIQSRKKNPSVERRVNFNILF